MPITVITKIPGPSDKVVPLITRRDTASIAAWSLIGMLAGWVAPGSGGHTWGAITLCVLTAAATGVFLVMRHLIDGYAIIVPADTTDSPVSHPASETIHSPQSVDDAVEILNSLLGDLAPWPEKVTTAVPEPGDNVRWNTSRLNDPENLSDDRVGKMVAICSLVERRLRRAGIAHRMPQLWLVADDGAVIELLGRDTSGGRCGTLINPCGIPDALEITRGTR